MHNLSTKCIRAGEPDPRIQSSINVPIFQTAMFEHGGETAYHALGYTRLNNKPRCQG